MLSQLKRTAFVATVATVSGLAAHAGTLVRDGQPVATIVIRESALAAEPFQPYRALAGTPDGKVKLAAIELQTHIERMSGAKLPIVSDARESKGAVVFVGASPTTGSLKGVKIPSGLTSERNEEGFQIFANGDMLVLAGNDEGPYQGTFYAVAEFLRRQGVRWILPGGFGDVVPKKATIEFANMNLTETPSFRLRTWWCNQTKEMGEQEALWKLRNKMGIADTDIIGIPGDSYLRQYMPDPALTNTTPELFGRNLDGSLNLHMPNLSNPDAAKAVAEKVLAHIRKTEAAGQRVHSLGFAPDDGIPMDHTPKTIKEMNQGFVDWVGREGVPTEVSVSEEWFTFMNRVAEHVTAAYPDFILTSNGYANRALPPEGMKLHPRIGVMGAFIWADTTKPVTSPKSWHGAIQGAEIKRWCELSKWVFLYEYNLTMLVTALTPVPQVQKMASNYPLYQKWGMIGFFNEARQPYFEEGIVTRYMRAQLMWNTDLDVKATLDDYYANWYGPAAKPLAAFWKAIEDTLLESPLLGHEDRILPFVYSETLLKSLEKHCSDAEKQAGSEPFRMRVKVDRLTLEHLKSYMAYKDAEFDGKFADAVKHLNAMLATREELNKISPFLAMPASEKAPESYYAGDHYWGTLRRRDYFQKVHDFTSGKDGDLVALAPRRAKFTLDPAGMGKDLRWHDPKFDRSKWREMDTCRPFYYPDHLSAEGIPWIGRMWYVFEVNVPSSFQGKPVRAYTPFVTTEAWVWVNGEYAGVRKYLDAYWSPAPLDMDVTNLVKPGQNTIAVWVATGTGRTQATDGFLGRLLLYSPKDAAKRIEGN